MNQTTVFAIVLGALRGCRDERINDVTSEDDGKEVILTTDDGSNIQTWVLSADGLTEADNADLA